MAKQRTCVVRVDGYETRFLLPGPGRSISINASDFEVKSRPDKGVILRCWEDRAAKPDEIVILLRGASLPSGAAAVVDGVYFIPVVVDDANTAVSTVVAATRKIAIPKFFWDDDELQTTMNKTSHVVGCISRSYDEEWVASILSSAVNDEVDDFYGSSFSKLQRRLARTVNRG